MLSIWNGLNGTKVLHCHYKLKYIGKAFRHELAVMYTRAERNTNILLVHVKVLVYLDSKIGSRVLVKIT